MAGSISVWSLIIYVVMIGIIIGGVVLLIKLLSTKK